MGRAATAGAWRWEEKQTFSNSSLTSRFKRTAIRTCFPYLPDEEGAPETTHARRRACRGREAARRSAPHRARRNIHS